MKIAIVGATGLVGRNIIKQCERLLPQDIEFHLFASSKSAGEKLTVNNEDLVIKELNSENIEKYDIAFKRRHLDHVLREFWMFDDKRCDAKGMVHHALK